MKIKRLALILLIFAGLNAVGLFFFVAHLNTPPAEAGLIQNFKQNRAAFEQLKDMLIADRQLRRVAYWGVDTTKPAGIFLPPAGNFPVERFNQYLTSLEQAGGKLAYRCEGEHPNPGIIVWGTGFAGDTRHFAISWEDRAPTNQVASLDKRGRTDGNIAYRHIDGNWYLWAD